MKISPPFEQSSPLADLPGIVHGFFGRRAEETPTPPDFDMSLTLGTPITTVEANRRRALIALGLGNAGLVTVTQIHSTRVVTVDAPFSRDHRPEENRAVRMRASFSPDAKPEADAIVTKRPGLALGIVTADCAPILFADAKKGIVAACHAGRRGAAAGIIGNTIEAMEQLGAKRERIRAGIGATISGANYELSRETIDQMAAFNPDIDKFAFTPEGETGLFFDLPGFVLHELDKLGIAPPPAPPCSYADESRYFSHRRFTQRGGRTGRQISIIAFVPEPPAE